MSSDEHKQSQIPSSFSAPDIDVSMLSSQKEGTEQNSSSSSSSQMITSTATISDGSKTLTTSMVKSSTTNGIKFNTTRDSGFSDSIVEDTSSSSLSTLAAKQQQSPTTRTEHALNVTDSNDISLVTKCFVDKGKLKSVEEDIHITPGMVETTTVTSQGAVNADDANKEFITIVKTTKVTTKVKHVNTNNGKANKKNKSKNKRRKSFEKSEEDDENNNNDGGGGEETEQQQQVISSQSNENRTITTTTTTTIQSASTLVTTNDDDDYALPSPSLQININKIGEELIYDNSSSLINNQQQVVPKLDITLLSSSTTETSNLNNQVDLNSTVLDCEEILSNYSTNNIGSPRIDLVPTRPVNEVANAVEVLSDVTMSLINKTDANVSSPTIAATTSVPATKENKKKSKTSKAEKKAAAAAATATTGKKEKKRQKFPSCFKTKDDENDETERTSQKRKNDKSVPVQESPSKQLKSDVSSKTPIIFNKYTLLDEPQKDRIIYLKPQCVDLIVNRLEQTELSGDVEQNTKKSQLSYLNENNYSLKIILSKMLNRSLDLLRHDRIESFDALANQLKTEYNVVDEKVDLEKDTLKNLSDSYFTHINVDTHDLVFRRLLNKMLIEDKILLSLELDKTKMKPYEEVIEFLSEENAASAWVKKFEKQKKDEEEEQNGAKVKSSTTKKDANLISEKKQNETIELNKPVKIIEEKITESSSKIMMKTSGDTQRVKNPDEKTVESLNAKNEIEAKLLDTLNEEKNLTEKLNQQNSTSSCGTTPPPTPQNELNQSQTPPSIINENAPRIGLLIEATPVKLEPERIVLNTIKEPPILFESDREGYEKNKPEIVAAAASTEKSNVIATASVEPQASSSLNKDKEQKKAKKSSFCGLSCTGAKAEKSEKPIVEKSEKKPKAKKDKKKSKEPIESKSQVVTIETNAENKPVNLFILLKLI